VTLDPATGQYSFTLAHQIDHPVSTAAADIDLQFGYTVTDGDNDSVGSTFTVAIKGRYSVGTNVAGTIVKTRGDKTFTLTEGTDYSFGADGPGTITLGTRSYSKVSDGVTLMRGRGARCGRSQHRRNAGFGPVGERDRRPAHPLHRHRQHGDYRDQGLAGTITGTETDWALRSDSPTAAMNRICQTDPQAGSTGTGPVHRQPPGAAAQWRRLWLLRRRPADTHTVTVTRLPAPSVSSRHRWARKPSMTALASSTWNYHVTDAQLNHLGRPGVRRSLHDPHYGRSRAEAPLATSPSNWMAPTICR